MHEDWVVAAHGFMHEVGWHDPVFMHENGVEWCALARHFVSTLFFKASIWKDSSK